MQKMEADRIKGALYGVLLGDSLGVPHEFKYMKNVIYTGILQHRAVLKSQYQPPKTLALGQYSDDSEMMITLLKSILDNNGIYDKRKVVLNYMEWSNSTCLIGKNTRELFKGIKTLKGYENRFKKKFNADAFSLEYNSISEYAQSNGSLMRCLPLAFFNNIENIEEDLYLTNPSTKVLECEILYIKILRKALKGKNRNKLWEYFCENKNINQEIEIVYNDIINNKQRDIQTNKGWIYNAFYCAMLTLYKINDNYSTFSSMINEVIKLGGDTDTNGAITGALLGAIIGFNNFDETTLTNTEIINNFMNGEYETDLPRNEKYMLNNVDEIVNKVMQIT